MPRRASSGPKAPVLVGIVIAALALAGAAFFALRGEKDSFSGVTQLHMADYLENGNSMRGMEFKVEGKVRRRFPRDGGVGVNLEIEEEGVRDYLFVIVPLDQPLSSKIARDQKYAFKIRFDEGGVAVATAVKPL